MILEFVTGRFSTNVLSHKRGVTFRIEVENNYTKLLVNTTNPKDIELLKKECETFLELAKCLNK